MSVARLWNVDIVVGATAFGFAVTSLYLPELQQLAHYSVSFAAACVAFGRGVNKARKNR